MKRKSISLLISMLIALLIAPSIANGVVSINENFWEKKLTSYMRMYSDSQGPYVKVSAISTVYKKGTSERTRMHYVRTAAVTYKNDVQKGYTKEEQYNTSQVKVNINIAVINFDDDDKWLTKSSHTYKNDSSGATTSSYKKWLYDSKL